jgi:hypothetical protein
VKTFFGVLTLSLTICANAYAKDQSPHVVAAADNRGGGKFLLTNQSCAQQKGWEIFATDDRGQVIATGCALRTEFKQFRVVWKEGDESSIPMASFALTAQGQAYAKLDGRHVAEPENHAIPAFPSVPQQTKGVDI